MGALQLFIGFQHNGNLYKQAHFTDRMDKETILNVLKRWNIWESEIDTGIVREKYIQEIYPYLERKEVLVLKGIRRSGKSTIMQQLMKELVKRDKVSKDQLLYLNLEDHNFAQDLKISLFDDVLKFYRDHTKNKKTVYFFIDEIQKIPAMMDVVQDLIDQNKARFILTGSSARKLKYGANINLLPGRVVLHHLDPLTLSELSPSLFSIEKLLLYGSLPGILAVNTIEDQELDLRSYVKTYLEEEVRTEALVRNMGAFSKFLFLEL